MRTSALPLAALLLLPAAACHETAAPPPAERVEAALDALGGLEAIEAAGGLTVEGTGTVDLAARHQGLSAARPDRHPVTETLSLAGGAVAFESDRKVNADAREWLRMVFDDAGRMLLVDRLTGFNFWDTSPTAAENRRLHAQRVPHHLLAALLADREALRDGGEARWQGHRFDVVEGVLADGSSMALLFAPGERLPAAARYPLALPLLGEIEVTWTWDGWRQVEGLGPFPSGHTVYLGDRMLFDVAYRVRTGADETLFGPPPGVEVPPAPEIEAASAEEPPAAGEEDQPRPLPTPRELADGVYLVPSVRGGFHPLFVELPGYVVAVDAPAGWHEMNTLPALDWTPGETPDSVGRRFLDVIRATVPDKPVRYVVLTHHHSDHAGGVRPFVAAGATVVATAETVPVIEAWAGDLSPRFRVVDGRLDLGDGERSVVALDVGDNPHAEGMLVVHLPGERLLYQSDLFEPLPEQVFPSPARLPVMRWFVSWLDRSGLDPERVYAIHGTARVTPEQLDEVRRGDSGSM
ncbi:MAG TPA: MBL fold metallo-hydrolase [Thermoanaerobaculia bacterium]|nr:MBL fold metallo-hydrolase [Thermoanaerobaculia bacterium]